MKTIKLITLALFVGLFSISNAKIYQWKDANGVMQFTQTPPPKQAGKPSPKVSIFKNHANLSQTDKQGRICGLVDKERLKANPMSVLSELRMNLKPWKEDLISHVEEYNSAKERGATKEGLQYIQQRIDKVKCIISFSKRKINELDPKRQQFLKELKDAEEELETLNKKYSLTDIHSANIRREMTKKRQQVRKLQAKARWLKNEL